LRQQLPGFLAALLVFAPQYKQVYTENDLTLYGIQTLVFRYLRSAKALMPSIDSLAVW
jgi:hypothetical protein